LRAPRYLDILRLGDRRDVIMRLYIEGDSVTALVVTRGRANYQQAAGHSLGGVERVSALEALAGLARAYRRLARRPSAAADDRAQG